MLKTDTQSALCLGLSIAERPSILAAHLGSLGTATNFVCAAECQMLEKHVKRPAPSLDHVLGNESSEEKLAHAFQQKIENSHADPRAQP